MAMLQPAQPSPSGATNATGRRVAALRSQDDVVGHLDEALRAAVRRDGLDPQREVAAVRRLAESLVREHDDRSLTGVVLPVSDAGAVVDDLVARVAGFGPLQPLLDEPTVEEVWINSPTGRVVAGHRDAGVYRLSV